MFSHAIAYAVLLLFVLLLLVGLSLLKEVVDGYRSKPNTKLLDELLAEKPDCQAFYPQLNWYCVAKPVPYLSAFTLGRRLRVAVLVLQGKCFGVQYAEDYYEKELNGKKLRTRDD